VGLPIARVANDKHRIDSNGVRDTVEDLSI